MFSGTRRRPAIAVALVVMLGLLAAPRDAAADRDDGSAPPADEMAERILEAATVRMKALVEEARLLEASGRKEEAVATLRRVSAVYEDAMLVVRQHLASANSASRPPAPSSAPAAAPGSRGARREEPPQWTTRVEVKKPLRRPASDPVGPAVDYLLARQSKDGFFREGDARSDDDARSDEDRADAGRDRLTTGLAILALSDVVGPFPDDAQGTPRREVAAVRAAADALARAVSRDGALSEDPLDHAYAAWGLATAYSRVGEPSWAEPLRRAVAHSLGTQNADGMWGDFDVLAEDADGEGDPSLLATAAQCGFLLEVLPTAAGEPSDAIRAAVVRARLLSSLASRPSSAGARTLAYDLLRRGVRSTSAPAASDAVARSKRLFTAARDGGDPFVLLWGTLSVQSTTGFEENPDGRSWWEDVIVPAMDRQRLGAGSARGSWDPPAGLRGGRLAATALHLLAWKVPTTEWIEPVAPKR